MTSSVTRRQVLAVTAGALFATKSVAFAGPETVQLTDRLGTLFNQDSLKYLEGLERQFMLRIGIALQMFKESVDRLFIANHARRFFWRDLDLPERPKLPHSLPTLSWPRGYELPIIDVATLSKQLQALTQSKQEPLLCREKHNLQQLEQLLHLQPSETALIELALASSTVVGFPRPAQDNEAHAYALREVLLGLNWSDLAERDRLFAVLLNVSLECTESLFADPSTLLALNLVDNALWEQGYGAYFHAKATDTLLKIFESQHLTQDALIVGLQEWQCDRILASDYDVPDVMLYEGDYFPKLVADAYVANRRSQRLTSNQLAAFVEWQTGLPVVPRTVEPLNRKLELETVCHTLVQTVLDSRRANLKATPESLIQALYSTEKLV